MKRLPMAPVGPAPAPVDAGDENGLDCALAPVRAARAPAAAYRRLAAVYAEVDRRIAAAGPRCDARGLCCDFERTDHVLYASKLEVDYLKDQLAAEPWRRPSGNVCPLLVDGRCTARGVRMLGCRTYFCQAGWEPEGAAIYEWAYARIQEIARDHDLPWRYAPALDQMRDGS